MAKRKTKTVATADVAAAMRDAADAGAVLMVRLPLLWLNAAAPGAARNREQRRMVSEKSSAAMAGAMAASIEAWRIGMTAWLTPVAPDAAMRRIAAAATAPGRRALRSNARRLKARRTI